MTVFVDASVLVAILGDESDAFELSARVGRSSDLITSPMSIWEAVTALIKRFRYTPDAAKDEVTAWIQAAMVRIITIGEREADLALEAYARFGKGRHPASLNMGDCFAYACAKSYDAILFYKGNDFSHTDLA